MKITKKEKYKKVQMNGKHGTVQFYQQNNGLVVWASLELKKVCRDVLGPPDDRDSQKRAKWWNVTANDVVELMYRFSQ